MIGQGYDDLDNYLDIRSIVRYQRAVKTLLRLLLSKSSRKLITMQRSLNVVDLPDAEKNEDVSSSDSAANYSDSAQTAAFLQKLSYDINGSSNIDQYTECLKKGVFSRSAVSFESP